METRWIEETTLGAKHKDFKWRYSSEEGIVILRDFKNAKDNETIYSNSELDQIFEYVEKMKKVKLANSLHKVKNGTEKEGLGKFAYEELHKKIEDQQATSQLAAVFVKSDIFGWNGAKKNMEFWLKDRDWRSRIKKVYDNHDTFEK